SGGIDKIFSPEKLSIDGSVSSRGPSPLPDLINVSQHKSMDTTITLIEEAVVDSQAKINALITDIDTSESSLQHLDVVKQLSQNIELMQGLLKQLRNEL
ncbi:hypothetical protein A2U01_0049588, partial [Trifolium medium]|nr:hypothetical protein [Trifolium medium]